MRHSAGFKAMEKNVCDLKVATLIAEMLNPMLRGCITLVNLIRQQ